MDLSLDDPVELAAKLASDGLDSRVLRWGEDGFAVFFRYGGMIPFERCLCLPSAQGLRLAQRNIWLCSGTWPAPHVYGLTRAAISALTLIQLPSPIFNATSGLWIGQVLSKHNVQFAYWRKLQFFTLNASIILVPTPGRRWRAEAFPALQNHTLLKAIHQGKASANGHGLTWNELPPVVALTGGNWGQTKPNIISIVALPSLVAVQNTTTRRPPHQGTSSHPARTGLKEPEIALVNKFF